MAMSSSKGAPLSSGIDESLSGRYSFDGSVVSRMLFAESIKDRIAV